MISNHYPEITVITAVFNGQQIIAETIRSILNQTVTDFEYVIVDDASTDGTSKEVNNFARQDKRIKVITNHHNLGLTASLNRALTVSKSKYIARIDAGDISTPNRLKLQKLFLDNHTDTALVATQVQIIDKQGNHVFTSPCFTAEKLKKILPKKNVLYHSSIMFHNLGNKYREKFVYAQDYDFYLGLLSQHKKIEFICQPLTIFRQDETSLSHRFGYQQIMFAQQAQAFYIQRVNSGRDTYASFNTQKILNTSLKKISDPVVLLTECQRLLKLNRRKEGARLLMRVLKSGYMSPTVVKLAIVVMLPHHILINLRKLGNRLT